MAGNKKQRIPSLASLGNEHSKHMFIGIDPLAIEKYIIESGQQDQPVQFDTQAIYQLFYLYAKSKNRWVCIVKIQNTFEYKENKNGASLHNSLSVKYISDLFPDFVTDDIVVVPMHSDKPPEEHETLDQFLLPLQTFGQYNKRIGKQVTLKETDFFGIPPQAD